MVLPSSAKQVKLEKEIVCRLKNRLYDELLWVSFDFKQVIFGMADIP